MLTIPSTVAEIASAFDGAQITAIDKADLDGWPTGDEISIAQEGELWVSKDISAFYHKPEEKKTNNSTVYIKAFGQDFTTVDANNEGVEKLRVYRVLDVNWYAWLYNALNKNRDKLNDAQWARMSGRFNIIWQTVRRWWEAETINAIHKYPTDYIPAQYTPPQPEKGTAERFKARVAG